MILKPAQIPSFLKIGFFGGTGTGKTFTSTLLMAQFAKQYVNSQQIAMFDTEPSAGFVAPIVKEITGKELLVCSSRSFADLMEFTHECIKQKFIANVDSLTHPWRTLCDDYLQAKKLRVQNAGGNPNTVRLTLSDWGPIKEMWNQFTELFAYSPIHFCINGREGDVWESVTDEEGNTKQEKTGVKMKTESECGYEPSILIQMKTADTSNKIIKQGHFAFCVKDRFNKLTGKISNDKPDIDFFRPHIEMLDLKGSTIERTEGKKIFSVGEGMSFETIKARRQAILENIKDDIMLAYPGQTADEKKSRIALLRNAFGTSSSTDLEENFKKYTIEILEEGREKIKILLSEREPQNA